ncbi:MAG: ATP-binding protein, partial [Pseudomonadota bacterium]
PLGAGGLVAVGSFFDGVPTVFVEPPATSAVRPGGSDAVDSLLRRVPVPAWAEVEGSRVWANSAYAKAVGATAGASDVVAVEEPLLDANASAQLGAEEGALTKRVSTIVRGERRVLDVAAFREGSALAAFAYDLTELSRALNARERALQSHAGTLDRLATAIAIFGPDRRLSFHNAAFATLWGLPAQFLEHAPREDDVLDRLRAERRLPETADFKAFKRDQLKGYETREGFERWWHLPDGQSLRVIANPGADGGVTYIYENVTEQLKLERRYNALARVQGETIDNLGEGVASFGTDGLLRLSNPAFFQLTGVKPAEVGDHVRDLAASAPVDAAHVFETLSGAVTGFTDHRVTKKGRLERTDGRVLDYAFSPLPDGSTLATFADVTDTVNVARALVERNNALEAGDKLKNAFIEHISYELRSPLNTIIGFTQLLTRAETGALSDRQREYAGYISSSSEALIVIIDGILDLATIDAGIMELSLEPVDVRASLAQVLDGLKDRVAEASLTIETEIDADAIAFEADAQRLRQVLFNLLSNAVSHSPKGGRIRVTGRREGEFVAIAVRDHGPGIAPEKAETVFDRFVTAGSQGRRGGVGLGLSLVKSFVELHGGTVEVRPVAGPGAEVVASFPRPVDARGVADAA